MDLEGYQTSVFASYLAGDWEETVLHIGDVSSEHVKHVGTSRIGPRFQKNFFFWFT